jgi:hypothetical protein
LGQSETLYQAPKSSNDSWFSVRHFAGSVRYVVDGFLEKNRDTLSPLIQQLVLQSTNPVVVASFSQTQKKILRIPSMRTATALKKFTPDVGKQKNRRKSQARRRSSIMLDDASFLLSGASGGHGASSAFGSAASSSSGLMANDRRASRVPNFLLQKKSVKKTSRAPPGSSGAATGGKVMSQIQKKKHFFLNFYF